MIKIKANLKKRVYATILDYALVSLSTVAYLLFFGEYDGLSNYTVTGLKACVIPIVWFIYFVIIEATYGATLGYKSFNLKVLTVKREEVEFSQALRRHLMDPFDILCYGIPAFIAIKFSEKHQRLGDMLAGTIVIDISDPEQQPVREKFSI
ncbi:RDD family protein [Pedobacter gandavensis]|uniref:RDD family protein n=1 Tax=Pedobacter gandavensis TaxID=2679963 RepID=UPI00292F629E|nr:RDD family protein [Pedobacter gandavensis]